MPDLVCTGCDEDLRDDAPEGPYKRFEGVGCGLDRESYAEHRHEHVKNLKARAAALRREADALDARAKAVAERQTKDRGFPMSDLQSAFNDLYGTAQAVVSLLPEPECTGLWDVLTRTEPYATREAEGGVE